MKYILLTLIVLLSSASKAQLITENFSSTSPSGWLTTGTYSCVMNYDGNATGNYRNVVDATKYSVRFPSAANGGNTFLYIPVTFTSGNSYSITFYTKIACSVTLNTNETADQTTLLTTETLTNASCSSNWSTWYSWTFVVSPAYTGAGYIQINFPTIYGGPTPAYLDDFGTSEITPLPIDLLSFNVKRDGSVYDFEWVTGSERNLMEYQLEYTYNGDFFNRITTISRYGNTNYKVVHSYKEKMVFYEDIVYFRLVEVDNDGNRTYFGLVTVTIRPREMKHIIEVYSLTGVKLNNDAKGYVIIRYDDETIIKVFKD